ncbi:MAG TPA: hypothetical protein VM510_13205 [Caulifigura sp.]|jgi:hypothetical protein|nr:hypothetical protein [Caulifigura sp.]
MIAQIITLVATLALVLLLVQFRSAVAHTTLTAAWIWSVIAAASWSLAAGASLALGPVAAATGQLWYVAAVLTLCPWIAVLGARRPTVRVWNWFVVVPLVAVLLWPVALCWMPRGPDRLVLEAPHLVGFGLVLMMGTGNYWGTRFLLISLMTAVSEFLIVLSLASERAAMDVVVSRLIAMGLMIWPITAEMMNFRRSRDTEAWSRLWQDFRDTFGIVWANRIAERVNAEAVKGNWSVRLQPMEFVATTPGQSPKFDLDAAAIEQTVRWLLRRFVDDEWINARLDAPPERA